MSAAALVKAEITQQQYQQATKVIWQKAALPTCHRRLNYVTI